MPAWNGWGRPPTVDRREVVSALLYVLRTGCQWRSLPDGFPRWQTVSWSFTRWTDAATWMGVNDALRQQTRAAAG